jgi:hypothetical protein
MFSEYCVIKSAEQVRVALDRLGSSKTQNNSLKSRCHLPESTSPTQYLAKSPASLVPTRTLMTLSCCWYKSGTPLRLDLAHSELDHLREEMNTKNKDNPLVKSSN